MRWLRWLAAAFAAITVLIVAAVVFVATVDLDDYKDQIRSAFRNATGREIEIDGPLDIAWTPRPSLTASGVRIANAEWAADPSIATVGELVVGIEVAPLLSRRIEVSRIGLSDVRLLLTRGPDGRGNWQTSSDKPVTGDRGRLGSGPLSGLRDLELQQVTVVVRDAPDAPETVYRIDDLRLTGDGPNAPLKLELAANVDGDQVQLTGTVPSLSEVMRPGATLPVDVEGMIAGTPVALAANVNIDSGRAGPRSARADRVALRWGELSAAGSGMLDLSGQRPRVEAALTAEIVDVAGLRGEVRAADGDSLDRPLPLELLSAVDGKIELTVAKLVADPWTVGVLKSTATLANGVLTVDPFSGVVADGRVEGKAVWDAGKRPAALAFAGTAAGMNMSTVYRALTGEALIEGRGDVAADLTGRGDTLRAVLGSIDGVARLVIRDGMIRNKYFELIAEDVATSFLPFVKDSERGTLNCLIGRFDVKRGIADATVLVIDTDRVTIGGEGKIDLARQTVDMRLVPQPKDPSLLSLATPILLKGPIEDPRPSPDPIGVAKGLGGLAAGAMIGPLGLLLPFVSGGSIDNPCPDAIAAAEGKRPVGRGQAPAAPEQDKPGGIKGLFDNLRKAIE